MGLLPCPYPLIAPSDPQVCSQVVAHWSMSLWKQKKSTHQLLTKSKTSPEVGSLFEKRIGPSAAQGSHLRVLGTAWGVDRCLPFSTWKPPGFFLMPMLITQVLCQPLDFRRDSSQMKQVSRPILIYLSPRSPNNNPQKWSSFWGVCFGVCFGAMLRGMLRGYASQERHLPPIHI